jgi:hypothetical protein
LLVVVDVVVVVDAVAQWLLFNCHFWFVWVMWPVT